MYVTGASWNAFTGTAFAAGKPSFATILPRDAGSLAYVTRVTNLAPKEHAMNLFARFARRRPLGLAAAAIAVIALFAGVGATPAEAGWHGRHGYWHHGHYWHAGYFHRYHGYGYRYGVAPVIGVGIAAPVVVYP
jgi:hypothetical protein